MRGFAASVLGVTVLLLLFYAYLSWSAVKDLDSALTEYTISSQEVADRSILEHRLRNDLLVQLRLCLDLVARGSVTVAQCTGILNGVVLSFSSSQGFFTCKEPVVYTYPGLRFACPVEGRVGGAIFRIPAGAEVRP